MEESIKITSTSSSSAEVDDIVLRKNSKTRLVFRPMIVKNPKNPEASVKGVFIFQRKKQSEEWENCNSFSLRKLKNEEYVKLELNSAEIKKLLDTLPLLKKIYEQHGIPWGESSFHITDENISSIIQQLISPENKDLIIQALEKFDDSNNLSETLLLGLQMSSKKRAITQFKEKLEQNQSEHDWQKWFKDNDWILSTEFVKILDEKR